MNDELNDDGLREEEEYLFLEEVVEEEPNIGDFIQVRCKKGCGMFYLSDLEDPKHNLEDYTIVFRCPNCNELQTGSMVVVD